MPQVKAVGDTGYTPYASPVDVVITICKEDTFGVQPTTKTYAKVMRRTKFGIQVQTDTYNSNEINSTAQIVDSRNGMRNVSGPISCELSPGSYTDIWEALLRGTWGASSTAGYTFIPDVPEPATSFTIERYITSTDETQLFLGCRVTKADIKCPATGIATVDFTFTCQNREIVTSRVFTSANAATTTPVLAAVSGVLKMGESTAPGTDPTTQVIADVTSFNLTIDTQASTQAVVGSNLTPDVFLGTYLITGSFTALYKDDSLSQAHDDETPLYLNLELFTDATEDADYTSFELNKIKITNAPDEESGQTIVQTCNFTAVKNGTATTGANKSSTICIYDSTMKSTTVSTTGLTSVNISMSQPNATAGSDLTSVAMVALEPSDAQDVQLGYSISGVADGLNLAQNGVVSGTPSTAGTAIITVTATDANGNQQTASANINIAEAPEVETPAPEVVNVTPDNSSDGDIDAMMDN